MAKWKRYGSRYTPLKRSRKFEEILGNVEEEYPNRSANDQYKIAMGIFKKTKYYRKARR
jgi:hypothetical protein